MYLNIRRRSSRPCDVHLENNVTNDDMIELNGDDGSVIRCRLLDLVSLAGKEYGVLLTLEDETLVVMRHEQKGEKSTFRTIENDAEFERVVAFVHELARQAKSDT